MIYPEGPYALFWMKPDGKSPTSQMQNQFIAPDAKFRTTNFVNITFSLNKNKPTKIAVVFIGPNIRVSKSEFVKTTSNIFTHLRLVINDVRHDINIASLTASVAQRMKYLEFGGYATVETETDVARLGLSESSQRFIDRCDVKDHRDMKNFVRSIVASAKLEIDHANEATSENTTTIAFPVYSFFSVVYLLCFALFCLKVLRQRTSPR